MPTAAPIRTLTPTTARRLAIARQRLSGPPAARGPEGVLDTVRDLGCVQLDPISAIARSHHLVLFSRLGNFELADLDTLLWHERSLFEYWAHVASIVLTEDYPVHQHLMRTYMAGDTKPTRSERMQTWLAAHDDLRRHILDEITARGPLPSRAFEDKARTEWYASAWSSGRNVTEMLDYLWTRGEIMVAGRQGIQRLWDLAERCLPAWTPRTPLAEADVVRRAAQTSLRALGVGRPRDIALHYTRRRYPGLKAALAGLEREGRVGRVAVRDGQATWPGPWYIHTDDIPLLDAIEAGNWAPRTTLLSPFDNLICDRDRTELLFDFHFRVEIYVPEAQREFGYYVLPVLHGDQLIGRVDSRMDRKSGHYHVQRLFAEAGAPRDAATGRNVGEALADLATFLEAKEVVVAPGAVPRGWQRGVRAAVG